MKYIVVDRISGEEKKVHTLDLCNDSYKGWGSKYNLTFLEAKECWEKDFSREALIEDMEFLSEGWKAAAFDSWCGNPMARDDFREEVVNKWKQKLSA